MNNNINDLKVKVNIMTYKRIRQLLHIFVVANIFDGKATDNALEYNFLISTVRNITAHSLVCVDGIHLKLANGSVWKALKYLTSTQPVSWSEIT